MDAGVSCHRARRVQGATRYMASFRSTLGLSLHLDTYAVDINPVGSYVRPLGNFRRVIEEETIKVSLPGVSAEPGTSLAFGFHTGCMPLVTNGSRADASNTAPDPSKRYFVSVLPTPASQISEFVFNDIRPINNAPDQPEEQGPADFTIKVMAACFTTPTGTDITTWGDTVLELTMPAHKAAISSMFTSVRHTDQLEHR